MVVDPGIKLTYTYTHCSREVQNETAWGIASVYPGSTD